MRKADKQPWIKFYPSDWRGDPKLRACTLAARGLWIECIGVMHEAVPYGHLLLNGQPVTDVQLAAMAGTDASTAATLIVELETTGVLSRTRDGTIYSRRMTRDAKKAAIARKNGKTGGNPSLGKGEGNPASDNPKDKPAVKPYIPEARGFNPSLTQRLGPARGARRAGEILNGRVRKDKDQNKADQEMAAFLAKHLRVDAVEAWDIVERARKPDMDRHAECAALCQDQSIKHRIGWYPKTSAA
jgi:hypothetical protein